MEKIYAVVVTYNRKDLLIECINSILKQSICVTKILIIDNNSTDGTYEKLKTEKIIENKKVEYIKLEKNIGGAGGFNFGIKKAIELKSDWVWVMDDDTIPSVTCLEELVNAKNIIPEEISYLASNIRGINNEPMNVPGLNTDNSLNGYPDWYRYLSDGIVKIKEATFVSLLINSKAIKQIGLPCKDYFIWGDDTEYTLRLTNFYSNAYFVGKSVAIHKRVNSKSLSLKEEENINRLKFHYYMIRNNLINMKEYYGKKLCLRFMLKKQLESFNILFSKKCNNRFKKFIVVHKGILAFLFKKYDYKSFKNRFKLTNDD